MQINDENKISTTIDNEQNQIYSNYYVSDKIVKTIVRPFRKDRDKAINIAELDKNEEYTLEELVATFTDSCDILQFLYEYDEFENIIKEFCYTGPIN